MEKFYQIIIISFLLMSCQKQKNNRQQSNEFSYSIEDTYKLYTDSISNFSIEKKIHLNLS